MPSEGGDHEPGPERDDVTEHRHLPAATGRARDRPRGHGREDVRALTGAVREPSRTAPGRTVRQPFDRDLDDPQARTHGVDRHPDLEPESGGQRAHRREGIGGERPLARQRLLRLEPARGSDQPSRGALHDPEPASGELREGRDRDVGPPLTDRVDERGEPSRRTFEIGVDEEPHFCGGQPFERSLDRPALPAAPGGPEHGRSRDEGGRARAVLRAIVDDHDLIDQAMQRRDRGGDPRGLLVRGDQRHDLPIHQRRQDSGGSAAPGTIRSPPIP